MGSTRAVLEKSGLAGRTRPQRGQGTPGGIQLGQGTPLKR